MRQSTILQSFTQLFTASGFMLLSLIFILILSALPVHAVKTRLIVTTDIGGADPDDQQSLVHLLTCLDRIDLEGIVFQHAWDECDRTRGMAIVDNVLNAYADVWPSLCLHATGFPSATALRSLLKCGQPQAAMQGVGEGKDTEGSEWIIMQVDKDDNRPVWISAWSGMNTLAQALWKVRKTRKPEDVERFVSRLRVYDILGQDDAGAWIVKNFPSIVYIRNKDVYGWAPSDTWIRQRVQSVGPLGHAYPDRIWAIEGDSPSFMYVIDNGLNHPEQLDWGGWGGRFASCREAGIRSMDWVVKNGLDETAYDPYLMYGSAPEGIKSIMMWQEDILNDFAARMTWTVTPHYAGANHHPIVIIGRDRSTTPVVVESSPGRKVTVDASSTTDPDGDALCFKWIRAGGIGTFHGSVSFDSSAPSLSFVVPEDAAGKTIHFILRVSDSGSPSLAAYRRIVVNVR